MATLGDGTFGSGTFGDPLAAAPPPVYEAAPAPRPKHVTPHLAFPLRYVDGRPVTVEQDSPEHLRDRIHVACRTPLGEALFDPTFGIPDQLMRVRDIDLDELATALAESEPDIQVAVSRDPDTAGLAFPADERIRIRIEDGG